MTNEDPFKDLRRKLMLARNFPSVAANAKQARAQCVIDDFSQAWRPLFDYIQSFAQQKEFRPQGKILKACMDYDEDSYSKKLYLRIGFCDPDEDMSAAIEPSLHFYAGLVGDADNVMSQNLYAGGNADYFEGVAMQERRDAIYFMLKPMLADNFDQPLDGLMFSPYKIESMKRFLNEWLAVQISSDLGQGAQMKSGQNRQLRFD